MCNKLLFVRHSRVDVKKYFCGNGIVKIWNSLPATAEDFACVGKFKRFIEHVDLSRCKFLVLCNTLTFYVLFLFCHFM